MYFFNDFCCICSCIKEELLHIFDSISDDLNYYLKLVSCIPEMDFEEMKDLKLFCTECCNTIDVLYKFRQKCLRSKNLIYKNISQLNKDNNITSKVDVYVTNKIEEINIKQEYGNEETLEEEIENIELKPSFENITEDKNEECSDVCFENEFKIKNNTNTVNLTQNENKYIDLEEIKIKCVSENQDSYADLLGKPKEIKNDCFQKNQDSASENQNFKDNTDANNVHKTAEQNRRTPELIKKSQHVCTICQKDCLHLIELIKHMRIHAAEKSFACDICNKNFKFASKLAEHMQTHTEEKVYKCKFCSQKFLLQSDLNMHIVTHNGEKPYECNICNQKFTRSSNLTKHKRIHTGKKPYECDICHHKFYQLTNLNLHMLSHTGEKLHECNICNKKFTAKRSLIPHMRTHAGERQFVCSICNMSFHEATNLSAHMRVHLETKSYECNICDKKFQHPANLSAHMILHKDKRFECTSCNKKFCRSDGLNVQMGEKPYECGVCKRRFTAKSTQNSHMKTHTVVHEGETSQSN